MKLRLHLSEDHQVDWIIPQKYDIKFQDVLDVIEQASDYKLQVLAFEYRDEDGDLVTVRTDQELHAMLNCYVTMTANGEEFHVFPKTVDHMNTFKLKVAIGPTLSSEILNQPNYTEGPLTYEEVKPGLKQVQNQQQLSQFIPDHQNNPLSQSHPLFCSSYLGSNNSPLKAQGIFNAENLQTEEVIGKGNSGVVKKAVNVKTGQLCAIKSIALDLTGEEQKRILLELDILQLCNGSPNIISFYGAFFYENQVMLCTEYMDAGSLDKYACVPYQVLVKVASSIANGLSELSKLKILHRDVKPSNMLVNTKGQIKLCDFGVSTLLIDSIARTYVGTNAYMAPERVVGEPYTIKSDIWSFGISILELAIGEFPYKQLAPKILGSRGVLPMELMQCIVEEDPPNLPPSYTSKYPSSESLHHFIACCLRKNPQLRMLPTQLCQHSLVRKNDNDCSVVARWLASAVRRS